METPIEKKSTDPLNNEFYRIQIRKDRFKFSAAHMTIFPDGSKEFLHGHNYHLTLDVYLSESKFESTVPFQKFKDSLSSLSQKLDEKILVAKKNPLSEISVDDESVKLKVCGKFYVFPKEEVMLIDIDNITVEALAYYANSELQRSISADLALEKKSPLLALRTTVHESRGQGASFFSRFA